MNWLNHLHPWQKLCISLIISILFSIILLPERIETLTRIMIGWDVFSFCTIVTTAITIFSTNPLQIRKEAQRQDGSRSLIFIIVIITTFASLYAILMLLNTKTAWLLNKTLETFIYVFGVTCSWFLLHTIFTLRYAHLYFSDHPDHPDTHAGGLDIPNEKKPNYVDFAYFSFVIGMTFQVSDIQIASSRIRRLVLLHSILSFGFNTVIVALAINVIAGLK